MTNARAAGHGIISVQSPELFLNLVKDGLRRKDRTIARAAGKGIIRILKIGYYKIRVKTNKILWTIPVKMCTFL